MFTSIWVCECPEHRRRGTKFSPTFETSEEVDNANREFEIIRRSTPNRKYISAKQCSTQESEARGRGLTILAENADWIVYGNPVPKGDGFTTP